MSTSKIITGVLLLIVFLLIISNSQTNTNEGEIASGVYSIKE